ncbi:glycoside hydrolase family 2 protein [Teredinibacter waterburyi]|uniref:glycoside hydrolase family 2 protein n=1 Tax=Teredinibacter waterburyi TaxID=1500538 RepID=UPI001FEAC41C|nr:glycoside hydrolase family 2 TIM barrel-domain containing protein [Teredinibacter waterburyi]
MFTIKTCGTTLKVLLVKLVLLLSCIAMQSMAAEKSSSIQTPALHAPAALAQSLLLQNPHARTAISLNGPWRTIVDPYENGFYNHRYLENPNGYFKNASAKSPSDLVEYDFSKSPLLEVPGDWNTQLERLFFYEGTVWYQKSFSLTKNSHKRYVLYFDAVNYEAVVYVNGEKVGRHEGGFTPFQFDVTKQLQAGDNFVVVKVDNRRERDNIPTVNTDWWNYGGITRPVTILELDRTYISDYTLSLDLQARALGKSRISGWVQLSGDSPKGNTNIHLQLPELGLDSALDVDSSGKASFSFEANPQRWAPQNPKLYKVVFRYGSETLEDEIGFRDIRVQGEDIVLNGEPIYLRGISIHEEKPGGEGRAWSEAEAVKILTMAKELGCNFVRLAHYPHNENMLRAADRLGLLVWSEIPVYWTVQFESEAVYQKAEQQLTEMIQRDKNRAAIILWSVANETPNHNLRFTFLKKLVAKARQLDATRLITAASDTQQTVGGAKKIDDPFAELVDVIGINTYCGWYSDKPSDCAAMRWQSDYNKPVIISEFGAGALAGLHGDKNARWTEEYQDDVYRYNLEMIDKIPFVKGMTPWILKDFRSPRRPLPEIQDYWNRKGLVSESGERKQAWYRLRDFYQGKAGG